MILKCFHLTKRAYFYYPIESTTEAIFFWQFILQKAALLQNEERDETGERTRKLAFIKHLLCARQDTHIIFYFNDGPMGWF